MTEEVSDLYKMEQAVADLKAAVGGRARDSSKHMLFKPVLGSKVSKFMKAPMVTAASQTPVKVDGKGL